MEVNKMRENNLEQKIGFLKSGFDHLKTYGAAYLTAAILAGGALLGGCEGYHSYNSSGKSTSTRSSYDPGGHEIDRSSSSDKGGHVKCK